MSATGYLPRLADVRLAALLDELPAVLVTGPRAAGKTTSARRLAADVLRLDDPAVAAAVAANPDVALRRAREPVLLDEWREQLGERFVRGIVFHTGPQPFELGERIWALPICALWSSVH